MPEIIYNYKKLSFANIEGIICSKIDNVCETGLKIDENTMELILKKIENIKVTKRKKELYKYIKKILIYIKLFDELEKRRKSKQMSKKVLTNNA